ncbi:Piso0_005116 [Millerozyma farinosa CBS 7064]|uniref:Piso0_005116 protein n=1 Tax=Pichia sorbitophila (strain ATCC MYA-4447 / BCRC 22081 / CBS 7064 / NBRC 10061 / NRRL Y-12695) TaxID=559304 RepID=G8Y1B3_PICSO|nr:Piso0_005116 [Millerozyma farinosa CBS 7064]
MESVDKLGIVSALEDDARVFCSTLNPQVKTLVESFIKYLKEPRYQQPLTLNELSVLFSNFYKDLNVLVSNLYTQSNSTKKLLISSSKFFQDHPDEFDYLIAISKYTASSSPKLNKRSDDQAIMQLRVFNFFKFVTILESIEKAQLELFTSVHNQEEHITLMDKIFRFDERDIIYQEFLDEKILEIKKLSVPFRSFVETSGDDKCDEFFASIRNEEESNEWIRKIKQKSSDLNRSVTPFSKAKIIVDIQKLILSLLADIYGKDKTVNNDDLIPAFIYIIINYLSGSYSDLYLNLVFLKNFLNLIEPYQIEKLSINTFMSNISYYTPTDKVNRQLSAKKYNKKYSIFELLNLKENDDTKTETGNIRFFDSDSDLIKFIQDNYLNNGEIMFYLTNLEAALFYLSNITVQELECDVNVKSVKNILNVPLEKLVEQDLVNHFKFPDNKGTESKVQQPSSPRSRSSSLLNAISHRINDVANSVNRSRSNSSILNGLRSSSISNNREMFLNLNPNADVLSAQSSPTAHDQGGDATVPSSMMKNLLGRISSVSVSQFRNSIEENMITPTEEEEGFKVSDYKHKRSNSALSRLSPSEPRTRSSSIENLNNGTNNLSTNGVQKRNSFTTKFTSGVSEFMTKFGPSYGTNPAAQQGVQSTAQNQVSNASLHTLSDNVGPENVSANGSSSKPTTPEKRPDLSSTRNTSLQVMDKWFNNISSGASFNKGSSGENNIDLNETKDYPLSDLTKYISRSIDDLTLSELKDLKSCYDKLCIKLSALEEAQGEAQASISTGSGETESSAIAETGI